MQLLPSLLQEHAVFASLASKELTAKVSRLAWGSKLIVLDYGPRTANIKHNWKRILISGYQDLLKSTGKTADTSEETYQLSSRRHWVLSMLFFEPLLHKLQLYSIR